MSLAGRITLAKFVLLAIPNYFMSIVRIPVSICKEIKRLARNFVWGTSSEVRRPMLASW